MTNTLGVLIFAAIAIVVLVAIVRRGARLNRAASDLFNERELFSMTLARIGDAVIATDLWAVSRFSARWRSN